MPVLVPLAASAAAYFGAGAVVSGLALSGLTAAVVGVVSGAVIGAAVGALGAAFTGGDIGKGALYGALGGAVAGGFAGYAAGAASPSGASGMTVEGANAAELGRNGITSPAGAAGGGAEKAAELGLGKATLIGSGLETAGTAASGWAQGEAQKEMNDENLAAAKEARQGEFEQRLEEIRASHQARLEEIGHQNGGALELADKNNAAAMAQLQTKIGADKDTVAAANQREDGKIKGFNDSIRGTDANLFNRPTFQFEPTGQGDSFESGFNEAVAAKDPGAPTPEQLAEAERQKKAAA
jgi:hypothetical protein